MSRRRANSPLPGRRPGLGGGQSVDFADYRRYSPGDEVRYIDWNLYARQGRLYTRQFRAESELQVHLLLDVSRSMHFGQHDKLACSQRLAQALAYVGLSQLDHVGLATFSDRVHRRLPPRNTGGQLLRILRLLERSQPQGQTDFGRALRDFARQTSTKGLAVVLSDFFSATGFPDGLELLVSKRFELVLIQVLAEEELKPCLEGEVELTDLEDPSKPGLAAGPASVATYLANLRRCQEALEAFCRRYRVRFARVSSSADSAELMLQLLQQDVWERA